ncbi:DUF4386 domain-containing protein [Lapillicoccus sp.]|uniref:DUF4386 domain-containing protein n=1 Tax=Lapillicoccus sp. TaxID=1909287 RepID=UPI0032673768
MSSPQRLARTAGVLYLLVGVFGGFAEGFVEPSMYVAGDAAATAANLAAHPGLVRMGVVADLLDQTFLVLLALTLFALLRPVHRGAARAMVVLVVLAAGIASLTAVFEIEGLRIATAGVDLAPLGGDGSSAMALLMLDAQHYGIFVAQVFFGLWLAPLGYLVYRSRWFPKPLGIILVVAAGSYLLDVAAVILVPDAASAVHAVAWILPAIAEVAMVVALLLVGFRRAKSVKPVEPTAPVLAVL